MSINNDPVATLATGIDVKNSVPGLIELTVNAAPNPLALGEISATSIELVNVLAMMNKFFEILSGRLQRCSENRSTKR